MKMSLGTSAIRRSLPLPPGRSLRKEKSAELGNAKLSVTKKLVYALTVGGNGHFESQYARGVQFPVDCL